MDYHENPEHNHRAVHVKIDFDAFIIGKTSSLKGQIRRAINTILYFGEKGAVGSRISDYRVDVLPLGGHTFHITINFDTWTTISPRVFTKPYWVETNMGMHVQGRLNLVSTIRTRRNFKIETSGEWENAHP